MDNLLIVSVSRSIFLEVLAGKCRLKLQDVEIPEDAEIVDVHEDFQRQCLSLLLRHPNFPPVSPGCEVARLDYFFCELGDAKHILHLLQRECDAAMDADDKDRAVRGAKHIMAVEDAMRFAGLTRPQ